MRRLILLSVLLLVAILLGILIFSVRRVLRVPADHATVQAAIDAATDGTTICIARGAYEETIDFKGKAIALRSESGPRWTTLRAAGTGYVVTFEGREGWRSRIEGFTIEGAGGILCRGTSPTIKLNRILGRAGRGHGIHCADGASPVIFDNRIAGFPAGHGIRCERGAPRIEYNTIENNRGGIACFESSATLTGNRVTGNHGGLGGGVFVSGGTVRLESNLLAGNRARSGGGLHAERGTLTIVHTTIAFNHAKVGGGLALRRAGVTVSNCILWGNRASRDAALHVASGRVQVSHSDVEGGWPGEGNLDSDPAFIDPENGDYHLPIHSPCRGKGSLEPAHTAARDFERNPRLLDGRADLGADEFYPALYRAHQDGKPCMRIVGAPGAPVVVAVSESLAPVPENWAHGDTIVLGSPVTRVPWFPIPAKGWTAVPLGLPPAVPPDGTVYIQALIADRLTDPIAFPGWRR